MFKRMIEIAIVAVWILFSGMAPAFANEFAKQSKIGVIAPLTGNSMQSGITAKAAVEIALQDFQRVYPDTSLEVVMEDSASDPNQAAKIAKKFFEQGIRILLVPGSSQEILAIKPFADTKGMIVIAPMSTAPSLALEDSIIRLTPNDLSHAKGLAEYLNFRGIKAVVPIYRNDVFGNDFFKAFKARFEEKGGSVSSGVPYDTAASDFSSYTGELSTQVQTAKQVNSASAVAVLTIAFGEIRLIFAAASNQPVLSSVVWYGTEDYARSEQLDNDPVARSFALLVQYTASIFSRHANVHPYTSIVLEDENMVTKALKLNSGISETNLSVMLDALWFTGFIVRNAKLTDVQAILKDTQLYVGYTGPIILDKNGDRADVYYNSYFRYVDVGNNPTWALVGSYKPSNYRSNSERAALAYREFIPDGKDKQIRIGLLLSLTGDNATMGKSFARMLEMAETDINALLQRKYSVNSKIEYVMANTESNPSVALTKIKAMKEDGIQFVIGPTSSAELEAIADYVNQNEMILISPCSTAVSLAKNDNIFRLTLDNSKQAYALAALMIHEGYRNVVGLYRNDNYGSELFSLFSHSFTEMGGHCGNGVSYDSNTKQFDGIVKALETQVSDSLKTYNPKQTAILMISFDEGISILETLANSQSFLADFQWYGGDVIAGNSAFLKSSSALKIALQTKLTAAISGRGKNSKVFFSDPFWENSAQSLGYSLTAYDVSAYDAAWLFTQLAENQDWRWDSPFTDLRSDFITLANNTNGYRSKNALNDVGDSLYGSIDFYRINSSLTSQTWDVYAAYWYFMDDIAGKLLFFNPSGDSSAGKWSLYQ